MKEAIKHLATWVLGLFNIGMYNLSDDVDSIIAHIRFLGLEQQANELVRLHSELEIQTGMLIMLDIIKCFLMLLSILILIITNYEQTKTAFYWAYTQISKPYYFFKNKLKNR